MEKSIQKTQFLEMFLILNVFLGICHSRLNISTLMIRNRENLVTTYKRNIAICKPILTVVFKTPSIIELHESLVSS